MNKIKILFISRAWGENRGGMERLSWELVSQLEKLPNLMVNKVVHEGSRLSLAPFFIKAIFQTLKKSSSTDIVWLGDPSLSFIGWLIKKLHQKPIVVTVHGLDVSYPHPLYQKYLDLFFNNFDLYLPISQHAKNLLPKSLINRTQVINPGIHDNLFNSNFTKKDLQALVKEPLENKVVLLTLGRLVKRKGHAWFIEHVFRFLSANTVYLIAGQGPEKQEIQSLITKYHLEKRIMLLGRVSDKDRRVLFNTVDAFIQPNISVSGDVEGFGLVLLEAALCQRPVFAANIDGIPDAIQHQKNGTLLPPQNPQVWIQELTNFTQNPQPYQTLAQFARHYTLKKFSWDKKGREYLNSIERLVEES